jgi:hypothetical protein
LIRSVPTPGLPKIVVFAEIADTGASRGGFKGMQLAALALKPPIAIITICFTVDRFPGETQV